jgi:plasmid stabilization system protein ParE
MIGDRFLPPAEEEMTEASLVYEAECTGLGVKFLDDVQRVIDAVREHPKLGTPVADGLRRALLRRFPFSLIYSEEPAAVLVVAVAHQRRRPGYWRCVELRALGTFSWPCPAHP